MGFLELRRQCGVSHEVRRGVQVASRVATGKSYRDYILAGETDTKQEITQNNVKIAILCNKEINQDNTLETEGGEVARLDREVGEGHSK